MASGSVPPSSSKSKSEEGPGDGVKSYDFMADTRWWLHPQPKDNATSIWEPSCETLKVEEYAKMDEFKAENPEKLHSGTEPELIGINRTGPWWRTTDLNDVASIVSERSFQRFDNLQTLKTDIRQPIVADKGLAFLDQLTDFTDSIPKSDNSIGVSESHVPYDLDDMLSNSTSNETENLQELSKTELLEALCHSQTRARAAENAAKQAYNEKEHVITHFLKQASHLFAYKQWLHILQLETTCLHLKNSKYRLVYTRFPDLVPWVRSEDVKRVRRKVDKRKPGSPRYKIGKSFGRFVLSLTLVGAGLLLGWTLGWLFR